ncbi:threonine/serine exporter family protein [Wukongibacter sp. M2B1]|uniref:threonine/serine exporter family protein n=1 Tax=Wukongibacter sp. M2B1 TaxID=3088895 RepID=UPI003D7ABB51
MIYFNHFIFSLISTVGFSVLFNVPKKSIFYAGLTGGIGWTIYMYIKELTLSSAFSIFVASTIVGILGEIFARIDKKPVTTFVIPGIVPLVPGYIIYLSMVELINQEFYEAARLGTEAVFNSGAISVGIILVTSVAKIKKSQNHKKSRL